MIVVLLIAMLRKRQTKCQSRVLDWVPKTEERPTLHFLASLIEAFSFVLSSTGHLLLNFANASLSKSSLSDPIVLRT